MTSPNFCFPFIYLQDNNWQFRGGDRNHLATQSDVLFVYTPYKNLTM